jgi:hypothetical protein
MIDERKNLPSASKISCYRHCRGAFQLSQGCSDVRTAEEIEWAESGNRIHAYLAGEIPADGLSESELDGAIRCRDVEAWVLTKAGFEILTSFREKRLWLKSGRKNLMSGKPDLIGICGLNGVVTDYKTSYGDQDPASENEQIRTNIVLAADANPAIEVWYGCIIQPLITMEPEIVRYARDDVSEARKSLLTLLEDIKKPEQPTSAGTHCRFCPAILKCKSALALLQMFGIIDGATAEGEALAKYLVLGKAAKPIIKKLEDRAKALLQNNPGAVPGWCFGKPGSTRVISDPFKAYEILTACGLIDRDTFMKDCISVGIGDLEIAVADFTGSKKKTAAETINEKLESVIVNTTKAAPLEEV